MIVGPARKIPRDLTPLVSEVGVPLDNGLVFLKGPLVLFDVRVEVVVPPFATLLANSPRKSLSDIAPILGPELIHIFREFLILFLGPRTLDHRWVEYLLPPVEALDVGPVVKIRCYLLPVFCAKLLDELRELLIFFSIPVPLGVRKILI